MIMKRMKGKRDINSVNLYKKESKKLSESIFSAGSVLETKFQATVAS